MVGEEDWKAERRQGSLMDAAISNDSFNAALSVDERWG